MIIGILKRKLNQYSKRVMIKLPGVFHIGRRALLRTTKMYGVPAVVKCFDNSPEALLGYENDLLSQELFASSPWMTTMVKRGRRKLVMTRYQESSRLDIVAAEFDQSERREAAHQAVRAMWDIFNRGYAHRDFHARNLFWKNGQIKVTDFETIKSYPAGEMPAFPDCYDLTGQGLASPFETANMGYSSDHPLALQQVLGVPVEEAIDGVREYLKERLREASLAFKTHDKRHYCKATRIYSSFKLPHFEVLPDQAQRNCSRRLQAFRADEKSMKGKSVIDLGSNIGGMLFESQKFSLKRSLGVEYDADKVAVSNDIVRFSGLRNVEFIQGDIDQLELEDVQGPFDVAFCLAIERHVKDVPRLYQFLGKVTSEKLFFEGNAGTDIEEVSKALLEVGFRKIEQLGLSDDDCLPENNVRPILVALK